VIGIMFTKRLITQDFPVTKRPQVVANYDGDTYRAVYTVRLVSAVFVLHCFQKKSKHGIKTSQQDIDLINQRLAEAIEEDKELRR